MYKVGKRHAKNATVTTVAGKGARWKRGDDLKTVNQKPNDGVKVESMAGVEKQPEGTAVTGQQSADSKDTATAPAKVQQHE